MVCFPAADHPVGAFWLMDTPSQIEINPRIMMDKPVIKGTRITVELILEKLSHGETFDNILEAHSHITRENIHN